MSEAFDYKNWKEEIWNAITHGIGLVLSIPALIVLIVYAVDRGTIEHIISFTIFGTTMFILYLTSTLLHSMPEKYKRVLSILDHSAIYLLIAGTYTPFLLVSLNGALGWTLFGIVWGLAICGILFKCFFIHRFEYVSLIFYVLMGWLIIIAIKPLYAELSFSGMSLLVTGGLFYTVGSVFYAWRKLPFNHTIWHLFVLAGSAFMYFCILFYV